ncbi:MAG TPA: Holliday junction resolvase RuvX [Actinobacteria bacterium]|nr:Holliday junction resolvase RuvX [Actinomycetota bacterium]
MPAGVLLACDVGTVRIGVARSDAGQVLAVPLDSVPAGDSAVSQVLALIDEYSAVEIIVGLPLKMDGTEGASADMARQWAAQLEGTTEVPVRLVDERLTTVQAQRGLHAAGRTVKNSRSAIDSASAVVLLQFVLESRAKR